MTERSIQSIRDRSLLVLGDISTQIDIDPAGRVSTRLGGFGHDVVHGVQRAAGTCKAVLLRSPAVSVSAAELAAPGCSIRIVESKAPFEHLTQQVGLPLLEARPSNEVQLAEFRAILRDERPAVRTSHVHLGGSAVEAWLAESSPSGASSASMKCSAVGALRPDQLPSLPSLLFLDADCGGSYLGCRAASDVAPERVLVHDSGDQIEIVVDGVDTVAYGLAHGSSRNDVEPGALSGASLIGLRLGMSVEEAVAAALSFREPGGAGLTPSAVLRLGEEERGRRVFSLMRWGRSGQLADSVRDAVAVLVVADGKLLIGRKPSEKAFVPDKLYLPGGKLEPGETLAEAARRELLEETGLVADKLSLCGFSCYRNHGELFRFAQFLADSRSRDAVAADDLATVEWRGPVDLRREELFPLTWSQLVLLYEYGTLAECGAPS